MVTEAVAAPETRQHHQNVRNDQGKTAACTVNAGMRTISRRARDRNTATAWKLVDGAAQPRRHKRAARATTRKKAVSWTVGPTRHRVSAGAK